jgi:hypothetical protein
LARTLLRPVLLCQPTVPTGIAQMVGGSEVCIGVLKLTIQRRLRSCVPAHALIPLQSRATTHVHHHARPLLPHVGHHGADESCRTKVHRVHHLPQLALGQRLDRRVDRVARVVDQHVDVSAFFFEGVDEGGRGQVVYVEREPASAVRGDFGDQVGRAGGVAGGGD